MHITNTLQGFSRERAANKGEYNVFVGNGIKVAVESIGFVKLKLSSGFVLELKDILYVPSMRKSLVISASKLVKSGFAFIGDDESVRIFHKNKFDHLLGIALLDSDLWHLQYSYFKECMNVECFVPCKRLLTNEKSSMLWHRRLGHISKERMERLTKDNILPVLDFTDF